MKKMKKYLSMSLAVIMALAMAAPSFAEPGDDVVAPENPPVAEQTVHSPKTNITMDDQPEDVTERVDYSYVAYKLLNASNGASTGGKYDLYAYTVNPKYENVLKAQLPENQNDVIAYLATLISENNEALREYANKVYKAIKEANMEVDATSNQSKFENVDQGYYLIADVTDFTAGSDDTNSLVMLDTAGKEDLSVKVKKDKPTVDKKIVDGENEVDTSDATRNEEINYRLTGTLPSDYATYETYFYKFTDTLSKGLDFVSKAEEVVVKIGNNASNAVEITTTEENGPIVTINDKDLTVEFKNLKKFQEITKDTKIFVEYKAKLNNEAVIGAPGNDNKVKLEYSNNPYSDGEGEKGTTPDKYVELLTFQLTINKVNENENPLAGAGFTLSKKNGERWEILQVISGVDEDGIVDESLTKFDFTQLGEGTYKIEETTVPDGYNKADDITFTIVAETKQIESDTTKAEITKLELTDVKVGEKDIENASTVLTVGKTEGGSISGVINTTIKNVSGTKLPSTGGIGTTIFYAAGIILMAGAVFIVVRRKRA